jgi:hypothetical protein
MNTNTETRSLTNDIFGIADTLYIADFMITQSVIVMVHTGDATDPFDLISMLQATEKNLAIDLEFGNRKVRFKKAYRNS